MPRKSCYLRVASRNVQRRDVASQGGAGSEACGIEAAFSVLGVNFRIVK